MHRRLKPLHRLPARCLRRLKRAYIWPTCSLPSSFIRVIYALRSDTPEQVRAGRTRVLGTTPCPCRAASRGGGPGAPSGHSLGGALPTGAHVHRSPGFQPCRRPRGTTKTTWGPGGRPLDHGGHGLHQLGGSPCVSRAGGRLHGVRARPKPRRSQPPSPWVSAEVGWDRRPPHGLRGWRRPPRAGPRVAPHPPGSRPRPGPRATSVLILAFPGERQRSAPGAAPPPKPGTGEAIRPLEGVLPHRTG